VAMHVVDLNNSGATSERVTFGQTRVTPMSLADGFLLGPTMPTVLAEDEVFFWTPQWQAGERASELDYGAGRFHRFDTVDDAIHYLLRTDEPPNP
jgi:hypothetical protein